MQSTKEKILLISLGLFAKRGYNAVSVRDIAGELSMTQSSLYKHYSNKRAIFDAIVQRMAEKDYERAKEYEVPEDEPGKAEQKYSSISAMEISDYTKAQFRYWTQDSFAAEFRRMITLERYSDLSSQRLFDDYLGIGVLKYVESIFRESMLTSGNAEQSALEYYAPVYMLMGIYDTSENKKAVTQLADRHIDGFFKENYDEIY